MAAGKPASPFGKAAGASPFGAPAKARVASSAAKPFTGAGNQNLFKEADNLSPFMQPEQMEEKPWWQNISLGQVVRPLSVSGSQVTCLEERLWHSEPPLCSCRWPVRKHPLVHPAKLCTQGWESLRLRLWLSADNLCGMSDRDVFLCSSSCSVSRSLSA